MISTAPLPIARKQKSTTKSAPQSSCSIMTPQSTPSSSITTDQQCSTSNNSTPHHQHNPTPPHQHNPTPPHQHNPTPLHQHNPTPPHQHNSTFATNHQSANSSSQHKNVSNDTPKKETNDDGVGDRCNDLVNVSDTTANDSRDRVFLVNNTTTPSKGGHKHLYSGNTPNAHHQSVNVNCRSSHQKISQRNGLGKCNPSTGRGVGTLPVNDQRFKNEATHVTRSSVQNKNYSSWEAYCKNKDYICSRIVNKASRNGSDAFSGINRGPEESDGRYAGQFKVDSDGNVDLRHTAPRSNGRAPKSSSLDGRSSNLRDDVLRSRRTESQPRHGCHSSSTSSKTVKTTTKVDKLQSYADSSKVQKYQEEYRNYADLRNLSNIIKCSIPHCTLSSCNNSSTRVTDNSNTQHAIHPCYGNKAMQNSNSLPSYKASSNNNKLYSNTDLSVSSSQYQNTNHANVLPSHFTLVNNSHKNKNSISLNSRNNINGSYTSDYRSSSSITGSTKTLPTNFGKSCANTLNSDYSNNSNINNHNNNNNCSGSNSISSSASNKICNSSTNNISNNIHIEPSYSSYHYQYHTSTRHQQSTTTTTTTTAAELPPPHHRQHHFATMPTRGSRAKLPVRGSSSGSGSGGSRSRSNGRSRLVQCLSSPRDAGGGDSRDSDDQYRVTTGKITITRCIDQHCGTKDYH